MRARGKVRPAGNEAFTACVKFCSQGVLPEAYSFESRDARVGGRSACGKPAVGARPTARAERQLRHASFAEFVALGMPAGRPLSRAYRSFIARRRGGWSHRRRVPFRGAAAKPRGRLGQADFSSLPRLGGGLLRPFKNALNQGRRPWLRSPAIVGRTGIPRRP